MDTLVTVIPAQAGIQLSSSGLGTQSWTPAFAGVTTFGFEMVLGSGV